MCRECRESVLWIRAAGDHFRGTVRLVGMQSPATIMRSKRIPSVFARLSVMLLLFVAGRVVCGDELCRIEVVDEEGRRVPLVELRTVHQVRLVSDNAGMIAFDLPELMGREAWFDVIGHGYEVRPDEFGYRGVRLTPRPDAVLRVVVRRRLAAIRIGRLTGAGRLAESRRLGLTADDPETGIVGCDSVQNAVYRGKLYWFWGDTGLPHYPLGIFHTTGAITDLLPGKVDEAPISLRYEVFRDAAGRPRGVAPMPGEGPTWITGVAALRDREGRERLGCAYAKIRPPLEAYRWGLAVWDDDKRQFEPARILWEQTADGSPQPPPLPRGHAVLWKDPADREWVLFGDPFPTLRCPATFEAWLDPNQWETLETPDFLWDADHQSKVVPHSGAVAWHPRRQRWVAVFMEQFGKPSAFGELWYAEALQPTGPWGRAVKIVTHDNYTFYNPAIHPEFTTEGSSSLFFEATYTQQFADHAPATPRHDYNQILYRLDLDDPRLAPARDSVPR